MQGKAGASDSLIAHYLSDTRDAARKIRELDSLAVAIDRMDMDKAEVIRLYQLAITLAPYVAEPQEAVAMMYARFSGQVFHAGAEELGVHYQKTALALQRAAQSAPNDRTYNMLGTVGSFYLRLHRYDSALVYYRQAVAEARRIANPLWTAAAYNNLGMLLAETGQESEARAHYDTALVLLAQVDAQGLQTAINDNIARLCMQQRQYDTARLYFERNLVIAEARRDTARLLATRIGLLEIAAATKQQTAGVVENCKALLNSGARRIELDDTLKYLRAAGDYDESIGDVYAALLANKQLARAEATRDRHRNDNLNAIFSALTESRLYQFGREIDHYQSNLAHAQKRAVLRNIILGLVLVVAALTILLLRRHFAARHQRQRQETDVQKLRAELAENTALVRKLEEEKARRELELRNKDLADLGMYLGKIKGLYESLTGQIASMKELPPEVQGRELRRITTELNVQLQAQDKLAVVQEGVREASSDWNARIIQQYPNLTKAELELCAFIRLNLSNKDIAALKNISQDSVKKARHRLRQKLALGQEEDLYRMIAAL